jgi:hypothetical protein
MTRMTNRTRGQWCPDDQSDEESEEAEIITPTKEELISAAARVGFQIEDLIRAEEEIVVAKWSASPCHLVQNSNTK